MRIVKAVRYVSRLLLVAAVGLALVGFIPTTVHAETKPVDLVLGGEGATSWSITDIKPSDNGTELVQLHNAGSKNGFVTIWVSDIVSDEGLNPEAETGNTTGPGEFADYLLLGLAANGLTSDARLPTAINNLPQSATGPGYIEVIPLKSGNTIDLQWEWGLPAQTGNDVQGDSMSFTINYLLQECTITDVSNVVTSDGTFTVNVTAKSVGNKGEVTIPKETVGETKEGEPVSEIWIIETDKKASALSENMTAVGQSYEAGPEGTTFDRPITITFSYEPEDIPERVNEKDLVIALWDKEAAQWIKLEGCTVDTVRKTITAQVSHFSRYTIVSPVPPPLPPPAPAEPPAPIEREEEPAAPVIPPRTLEVDMLGKAGTVKIGADGTLEGSLRLIDSRGNFVIDINGGTKVTGSNGIGLSRIDLRVIDESIVVPDNMVILSPIYELTGYTQGMETTQVKFEPPARLTISYNPRSLPENAFAPFIANYTDEQGLLRLEPPPDSLSEVGKAKAMISHASLFAVVAELAPSPPPLPATFKVSNLIINPGRAEIGQPVVITLTIANEGAVTGSHEMYLVIDGIVRAIKEVTLTGNSAETISFEVSNLAAGRHQVKIAGLSGEFRIIAAAATLPTGLEIDWLFIDLSIVAVLTAGLLTLYLLVRRSQRLQLR